MNNNNINDNFGMFGFYYKPFDSLATTNSFVNQQNERSSVLNYAKQEVQIGTPDSIGLAVNMLKLKGIEIPLLTALSDLHNKTYGTGRDVIFAKKASDLQKEVIEEIDKMLASNN